MCLRNPWTATTRMIPVLAALIGTLFLALTGNAGTEPSLLERAYELDAGTSAPRDPTAAAALYARAAQEGDAFAELRLGYMAETGDGVPQDYAAARSHYVAAAAAGLKEGHLHLAICYLEGWGVPSDRHLFAQEMQAAAEMGDAAAERIMAHLCMLGIGVPKDPAAGVEWLQRAAAQDDPDSQLALGYHVEHQQVLGLMPDVAVERGWFQLSAEHDYHEGMRAMARTFLTGDRSTRNWRLGQQWLQLATTSGDAEAPFILAACELLHVDSPTRDTLQAQAWLKTAAGRGNDRATEVLRLEARGRSLADALRYVLWVPGEDRYVEEHQASPSDGRNHPAIVSQVVRPVFPEALRLTDTTGRAVVDFAVDPDGRVVNPLVYSATHPLFGESAVAAVRKWRFRPAMKDGRPVFSHWRVPVQFQLSDERLDGNDGLLEWARNRAAELGTEVQADATDLVVAKARRKPQWETATKDNSTTQQHVVLLLVLNPAGQPVRGHILWAEPASQGPLFLSAALAAEFEPRKVDGNPVPTNAVLNYTSEDLRVLR